jgi:hypothetical protein
VEWKWSRKAYANIIDRDAPEKGVQLLGLPMSVFKWLVEMMADSSIGDVTDTVKGADILIKKNKTGEKRYEVEYVPTIMNSGSPLSDDQAKADTWLGSLFEIDKIFKRPNSQAIHANLNAANSLLKNLSIMGRIDPDNLLSDDKYVNVGESVSPGGAGSTQPPVDEKLDCFGQFGSKDTETCYACPDEIDCKDRTDGVGAYATSDGKSTSDDDDTVPF